MDFPTYGQPASPILHVCSHEFGLQPGAALPLSNASSSAWPANNLAIYVPFRLSTFETVYQLLFYVGATSGGNIDVAVYDAALRRIIAAGTTAMSATINTVQELNVTDTVLPPGEYLLGAACSSTSGTAFRLSVADEFGLCQRPIYEEALGGLPLPATATPVFMTQATLYLPLVGIQLAPTF